MTYKIESTNINKVKIVDEHKGSYIGILAKKSNRKNAKSEYKDYYIFKNTTKNNIVKEFNASHILEILSKIISYKKRGYKVFNIRFNANNTFVTLNQRYSFEQYINDIFNIMELINGKEFYFTLNDLHNDSNIKFLINEFYKEGV